MDIDTLLETNKKPKDTISSCNKSEFRRRDPIGQILDSLCDASKNSDDVKRGPTLDDSTVEDISAFTPFTKKPSSVRNDVLSNTDTPVRFMSPHGYIPTFSMHQNRPQYPPYFYPANIPSSFPMQFPLPVPPCDTMVNGTMPLILQNLYSHRFHSFPRFMLENSSPFFTSLESKTALNFHLNMSHGVERDCVKSEKPSFITSVPPRYQCENCKKSYSTYGGLSKHKQFHCTTQHKRDFSCKYCGKSYGSMGALKMHIRTHTLPCKCKICGKAFSRPWLLQGHMRTHTGEKPFSCLHCARAFADRSNLRAHLQTHSDIKKYGCKMCSKTFSRMSLLVKHRENNNCGLK